MIRYFIFLHPEKSTKISTAILVLATTHLTISLLKSPVLV